MSLHEFTHQLNQELPEADKLATKFKVSGTPTILVGTTGGPLHDIVAANAAPTLQDTEQALDAAIANS